MVSGSLGDRITNKGHPLPTFRGTELMDAVPQHLVEGGALVGPSVYKLD